MSESGDGLDDNNEVLDIMENEYSM